MARRAARLDAVPTRDRTPLTLDALSEMNAEELTALYRAGSVPSSLAVLDGMPRCRALAFSDSLGVGAIAPLWKEATKASWFPWAGKSFQHSRAEAGWGVNRVRLGVQLNLFGFTTSFDRSAIDGEPCILLDYDHAENPFVIRKIRDELREVSTGLFLGPAMAILPRRHELVLYFAIDQSK
ncbi:MAG: hypothetical protein KC609_01480 [Myxococcales bacterium]|nr:hypothetical protein [Myxococcales bacterium]